jgi:hypothetical protein
LGGRSPEQGQPEIKLGEDDAERQDRAEVGDEASG